MPVKIAFIHHTAPLYGATRSLINLIQGLKAYDVEPYVIIYQPGEAVAVLESMGCQVARVPFKWWVAPRGRIKSALSSLLGEGLFIKEEWHDVGNLSRVIELLKSWDVDLVQSNSAVIPVGHYASRALKLPHIWHLREFMENYDFHYELGESRSREIINSADACIAISDSVAEHYFDPDTPGIKRVIRNGVLSRADFDAMREKSLAERRGDDTFAFGMIGMIHPSKGFDVAIRALSLVAGDFPRARLVIAGSGDLAPLKRLASRLGVASRVEFAGFVDDPFAFYPTIDALLMCSKKEALGRVTLEAQACCKPVIGYDGAGTSELIRPGATGLLYRGEHEELAAAMRLYLQEPELARQMGCAAWEVARADSSIESYAGQFYQVVQEILGNRKNGDDR